MRGEFSIYEEIEFKFEKEVNENFLNHLIDMRYEKDEDIFHIKDLTNSISFNLEIKDKSITIHIKDDYLEYIKDIENRVNKAINN